MKYRLKETYHAIVYDASPAMDNRFDIQADYWDGFKYIVTQDDTYRLAPGDYLMVDDHDNVVTVLTPGEFANKMEPA
jgi:hypothetical protein